MADALLSPAVGGVMWAASATAITYSARRVQRDLDDLFIPLMGVLGAFIFAAQMINFTIPATGSSGHLAGGMILAILLGPAAGFLTMASILTVQALLFGDGGLLALGANIINLGFFPCFVAYPLVYRTLVRRDSSRSRRTVAAVLSSILALQLGALAVVLQTVCSGITALEFSSFLLLMLPIHGAIGVVDGIVTASVVALVRRSRPEFARRPRAFGRSRSVLIGLAVATLAIGTVLAWFASSRPDGLEWSVARSGSAAAASVQPAGTPVAGTPVHQALAAIQQKTAMLPDYNFKQAEQGTASRPANDNSASWPTVRVATSVAGLVGGLLTLLLVMLIGLGLRKTSSRPA